MRIERRHLIDFGLRDAQLFGQRPQMRGGQMTKTILNEMQILDQQIAAARRGAKQLLHLLPWLILELAALRRVTALALARFPDALAFIQCHARVPCLRSARQIHITSPPRVTKSDICTTGNVDGGENAAVPDM